MLINVRVKPRHSERKIESFGDNRYLVYVKSEPEDNKANIELINMLSKYFGIPVGRIRIKMGLTNNDKVIELS